MALPILTDQSRGSVIFGEPKTLVDSAYKRLSRDIIEGRYSPGEKLRVEHIKGKYNVGAGTMREALYLVASDNLVESQSQKGFRVASMSLVEFKDIARTRKIIEAEALRQSFELGDEVWEARVISSFHHLSKANKNILTGSDFENWEARNKDFHQVLISASDSHWLKHFLSILYLQTERYRHVAMCRSDSLHSVHKEHESLFNAAMSRDAERAVAVMDGHMCLIFDDDT